MVWDAAVTGQFLDSIEGVRLYPLYHLASYWGMRRQELVNLTWADTDLATRRLHVHGDVKSEDSDRIVIVDAATAEVLKNWRDAQAFEALEWGDAWADSGRVFTRENGAPLRPAYVSEHFRVLIRQAGLPPVRLHDLRHGSASLAAGQPPKVVSEIMGHSTVSFTMDTYEVVAEELAEAAAVAIAAFVPRAKKNTEAPR
jgi:integrase